MNVIIKENNTFGTNQEHKLYYYFDGKEWVEKLEVNESAARIIMSNQAEELEPIRNRVLAGQLSPLAYHIESKNFTVALLASYTGIAKWRVKRHLKPKKFNQLNEEILKKYASAFGISVEELKKV